MSLAPRIDAIEAREQILFLKDVRTSGTAGDTISGGSWQKRTLNTIENQQSWLISLSSSQFTLGPGTYLMEGKLWTEGTSTNKARIRNVTDSTDDIVGTSARSQSSQSNACSAYVDGIVTLVANKTFELQHYASFGYTMAATTLGVSEVYAILKIRKIA